MYKQGNNVFKVYLVSRTDGIGYDEYDECVVIARDEDEAFRVADTEYFPFKRDKVKIEEIKLDKQKAVLGSFCAG